jgi:hypothetical protein
VDERDEQKGDRVEPQGGRPGGSRTDGGQPTSRQERLAAALRENLRRRKAQARARKVGAPDPLCGRPPRGDPDPDSA